LEEPDWNCLHRVRSLWNILWLCGIQDWSQHFLGPGSHHSSRASGMHVLLVHDRAERPWILSQRRWQQARSQTVSTQQLASMLERAILMPVCLLGSLAIMCPLSVACVERGKESVKQAARNLFASCKTQSQTSKTGTRTYASLLPTLRRLQLSSCRSSQQNIAHNGQQAST